MKARDILGKAILIRDITSYIPEYKVSKQTYKYKKFDIYIEIVSFVY